MAIEQVQFESVSQWAWNGDFASAAQNGAQFALYLALQFGASVGEPTISAAPQEMPTDNEFPQRLSFYRRPALSADNSTASHSVRLSSFISHGDLTSARLQDAMHPEPLSFYNDALRLPDNVIANCSLATQRRLQGVQPPQIEEDNTLLDDIIGKANDFIAA